MAINVRVTQQGNKESTASLLRRFSREVRSTRTLRKRRDMFFGRKPSSNARKAAKIERLKRTEEFEKKRKLGLLS